MNLLASMEVDVEWKSFIFNLPKGTMKFLLNASLDTLPTMTNLMQWGKTTTDRCVGLKKQLSTS